MASIEAVLESLRQVQFLSFQARSGVGTGWDGIGVGTVLVSEPSHNTIIFSEEGTWQPSDLKRSSTRFTNIFRWSKIEAELRLEHLRFGPSHPVFLFDMAPAQNGEWMNIQPHHCSEDRYTASLKIIDEQIAVNWSIQGPEKSEKIEYTYSRVPLS